jgi:hypothetical protein
VKSSQKPSVKSATSTGKGVVPQGQLKVENKGAAISNKILEKNEAEDNTSFNDYKVD